MVLIPLMDVSCLDDGRLGGDGPELVVEHAQADDVEAQVQKLLLHVDHLALQGGRARLKILDRESQIMS